MHIRDGLFPPMLASIMTERTPALVMGAAVGIAVWAGYCRVAGLALPVQSGIRHPLPRLRVEHGGGTIAPRTLAGCHDDACLCAPLSIGDNAYPGCQHPARAAAFAGHPNCLNARKTHGDHSMDHVGIIFILGFPALLASSIEELFYSTPIQKENTK
jgi:hypothetical protein